MSAYIVVEVEVHDPQNYENYKQLVPASLAAYGGKFIVRGGNYETLEGQWTPQRLVILQFPNTETAKAWWSSAEYAAAKELRQLTAYTKMILIEGV